MENYNEIPRSDKRERCRNPWCLKVIYKGDRKYGMFSKILRFPYECEECYNNRSVDGIEFKVVRNYHFRINHKKYDKNMEGVK